MVATETDHLLPPGGRADKTLRESQPNNTRLRTAANTFLGFPGVTSITHDGVIIRELVTRGSKYGLGITLSPQDFALAPSVMQEVLVDAGLTEADEVQARVTYEYHPDDREYVERCEWSVGPLAGSDDTASKLGIQVVLLGAGKYNLDHPEINIGLPIDRRRTLQQQFYAQLPLRVRLDHIRTQYERIKNAHPLTSDLASLVEGCAAWTQAMLERRKKPGPEVAQL